MPIKLALYPIGYQGIWYDGKVIIPWRKLIPKVKDMGWDGITVSGKRPYASVLDLTKKDCNDMKELCNSVDLELVAWDTYSNFMDADQEHREANLVWIREIIKCANMMEIPLVKIFAGWQGIVLRDGHGGYEWDQMKSPYAPPLEIWNRVKEGITEACKMAEDYGVTLALQNHPPPFQYGYEDCLAMITEIDHPSLKMSLDIPNFGYMTYDRQLRQTDEYIVRAVKGCREYIAYSHVSGYFIKGSEGKCIQVHDWPFNYPVFIRELKKIGYNGYLAYENCGPNIINHKLAGVEEIDRRAKNALTYFRQLL